jgi:hypothetical protein
MSQTQRLCSTRSLNFTQITIEFSPTVLSRIGIAITTCMAIECDTGHYHLQAAIIANRRLAA